MSARSTLGKVRISVRHWSLSHESTRARSCDRILLSVSLALPMLAQDTTQSQSSSQSPVNPPDQTQPAASADNATSPSDSPAAIAPEANAPKETHDKGKNDIDDIGNRKIGSTGKSAGDWYSIDTDIKMGKQYAMMVEQSARMIQDPVVVEYVNRIGQNLVRNSDGRCRSPSR